MENNLTVAWVGNLIRHDIQLASYGYLEVLWGHFSSRTKVRNQGYSRVGLCSGNSKFLSFLFLEHFPWHSTLSKVSSKLICRELKEWHRKPIENLIGIQMDKNERIVSNMKHPVRDKSEMELAQCSASQEWQIKNRRLEIGKLNAARGTRAQENGIEMVSLGDWVGREQIRHKGGWATFGGETWKGPIIGSRNLVTVSLSPHVL